MTNTSSQPVYPASHDAVFKQFLSDPATARDFIELHLPAELLTVCDLATLELKSGSFIEDDLRPYYSDILWSVKTRRGDGYIHVLIEHQSTPDKHMAFRLLRYAIAAMQNHLKAGNDALPLVIPVLFYQGARTPYPFSMDWRDLVSEPELARRLYGGNFPLVDITVIPDTEITQHRHMAALTLIQKHIRQRNLMTMLDKITAVLLTKFVTRQQLITLVNYILQAGRAPDASMLMGELVQRMPQHGEEIMGTIAKQLKKIGRDEGFKEGIQEGMQEGIQEGRLKEALKIALNMLQYGLDTTTVMKITGLSEEQLKHISH
ncbi:Rpn family recombination-promoting nuclease/putative transposase [Erwinia sp. V71]|uniref:Rpn family recombination-promoting nuclease/putative transposase n=1 Tax=Erwinia sp. V71 TaxID=3369424 RepID=UPI003F6202FF